MNLKKTFAAKAQWLSLQKRSKQLPEDYHFVYKEIQKYLIKVAPIDLIDDLDEILNIFEDAASSNKDVLNITGSDVAAFADGIITDQKTFLEDNQQSTSETVGKSINKHLKKSK